MAALMLIVGMAANAGAEVAPAPAPAFNPMTAHDLLANLATKFFMLWAGWLNKHLRPEFAQPFFGDVTWDDLAAVLAILLFTLVLHVLAGVLINRRAKVAKVEQQDAKHHVFRASTKPVYLLLWTFGVYFAVVPLLAKLPMILVALLGEPPAKTRAQNAAAAKAPVAPVRVVTDEYFGVKVADP